VRDRTAELEAINLEQKKSEEDIIYLSYHDQLTGLYNRRYFEKQLILLNNNSNLPLTIVMADMNGLKLINDSLGHVLGDELLKKAAKIMTKGCRSGRDIISRIGGDEFVILMPNTNAYEAEKIINRIIALSLESKVEVFDVSISFGYGTRNNQEETIQQTFKIAEENMYKNKLIESANMRIKTINTIIFSVYEKDKKEEEHSNRVSELCKLMGEALDLPSNDVEELKRTGLVHDIGKMAIDKDIINKPGELTNEEWKEMKRHPEVGYRILSAVNDMSAIAKYVLAHHERWDGSGYPKGLKGIEIPLQSRILSIAEAYDVMTSERSYHKALPEKEVIKELKVNIGRQFDPNLLIIFIEKVLNKPFDLY
jgi:diguanylate cyclase (GGDEF)-like protein